MSHASRKLAKIKAKEELAQIETQKKAAIRQRAVARSAANEARRAKLTPEQRKREDTRNIILGVIGVALIVVVIVAMISNRSSSSPAERSPGSGSDFKFCPNHLEDLGPFQRGDPLYDPAMDWDDDGVSCE